jgi:hypothetical protein
VLLVTAQSLNEILLRATTRHDALAAQAARLDQAMDLFQDSVSICPRCQLIATTDLERQRAIAGQIQELTGRVAFIVLHCSWHRMTHNQLATYVKGLFGDVDDLLLLIDIVE